MGERIAKIERTHLGYEDHGIFTLYLHVSYGTSGQGVGGYSLDAPPADSGRKRQGTAYGMEHIIRVIRACGVGSWEEVQGRTIIVYTDGDDWNAKVVGIGPLPTEPGEKFLFADLLVGATRVSA